MAKKTPIGGEVFLLLSCHLMAITTPIKNANSPKIQDIIMARRLFTTAILRIR